MSFFVLLGIILIAVAGFRSCSHGGRVAAALDSSDPALRAKAGSLVTFFAIIGALCLLWFVWPVVVVGGIFYLIWCFVDSR